MKTTQGRAGQNEKEKILSESTPVISADQKVLTSSGPGLGKKNTPAVRRLTAKLRTTRIGTLDFREETLSNILKLLTAVSKINFAVKQGSGKKDKIITPDYLNDVLEEEDNDTSDSDDDLLDTRISMFLKDTNP